MGRLIGAMIAAMLILTASAASAQPAPAPASPAEETFRAEIARLYTIDRSRISSESGMESVSAELDVFWNRVKGDRATYLPMLRAELVREGNPPFFYFDGAQLLRDASDLREDRELALASIERADLSMVNPEGYLFALSWFVNNGFDTRRAALRFLEMPRDTQIIAMPFPHVFYYSRLEALVFSLFGMDEERFVADLVERVQNERDDMRITYLLHCIWATATPQGRAALRAYAEDSRQPEPARRYAREMLSHQGDGPMPTQSADELRRQRRAVIANPFQHGSFERFHAITDQLVRIAG